MLLSSVSEACISYDPGWAYEISVIVKDALRRMYEASPEHPDGENIFYYLTVYNEPYPQPPAPDGGSALDEQILRGLYRYAPAGDSGPRAQIVASGVALRQAMDAQRLLAEQWGVAADVWSATSWTELRRDALSCESWNMLHPDDQARTPYVTSALEGAQGPVVAVSDWMRAVPDQIARWVPGRYTSLGTDGFGFSDTRPAARRFFHVDAESITLAVLWELARAGAVPADAPAQAIAKYKLDLPVSEALG
jgi:pyruvate dehydrogenase E1 component